MEEVHEEIADSDSQLQLNQTMQIETTDMNMVREANKTPTFKDLHIQIDLN